MKHALSVVRGFLTLALLVAILPAQAAPQPPHVMFILDASNSMWGQIGGVPKIDIAKDILASTAADLPEGTKTGLIAYGHRFAREFNDCDDMELVGGYSTHSRGSFSELLDFVTPKGQTPIANTLRESVDWVSMDGAENPTVVLITDGIESCDGDPCAAATALADAGISTKIHVVGFDLTAVQRDAMTCIADNGHGRYFSADDAAGLKDALDQVRLEVAQVEVETPVAPAPPSRSLVFEDDFDREILGESWIARNPDADGYILDDGKMLIASSAVGGFRADEAKNIMILQDALPDGDWDLNYLLTAEMKTGRDAVWFGLYKDAANAMAGMLWVDVSTTSGCSNVGLSLVKRASGEETQFTRLVLGRGGCSGVTNSVIREFVDDLANQDMVLTLSKRGREYSAAMSVPGMPGEDGQPIMFRTDALTSLRLPGQPAIAIGKTGDTQGEVLIYLDRVEIEALN